MTARVSAWLFAPLAALVVFAGYLGLRLGQPVSETEIITDFAARYVVQVGDGAAMTDCLARPATAPDIRLIVVCTHPSGAVYRYPSGPRGELRMGDTAGGAI